MFVFEEITAPRRRELLSLEKKLGVEFKKIELLNTALTHTSYANEKGKVFEPNERLEFLGDAVLELASSTYLFKNFGELSEGELTKTRAKIVCQPTLAKLSSKLGVGKLLLFGRSAEIGGGRTRESILEDAFEAIIGAIYLDRGWEVAKDFVFRQIAPEFKNIGKAEVLKDFKSALQILVQKNPSSTIEYIELGESGPDHMKTFEAAVKIDNKICGKGSGKTKKLAEQMAAKKALEKLNNGKEN